MDVQMKYIISRPHLKGKDTVSKIMACVIFSLVPIMLFSLYKYGINAIIHMVLTICTCIFAEYLYEFILKKEITVSDMSAAVTGILIALCLPAYAPFWIGPLGGIFAIVVIKQLFGGIGHNILNPAVSAKCFLMLLFPGMMRLYSKGAGAELPLDMLKSGEAVNTFDMITGLVDGAMGETCVCALFIGVIFLVLAGIIRVRIPAVYISSFLVTLAVLGGHGFDMGYIIAQLAGGGFMLVVWFMATDYTTSPMTPAGQLVFGLLLGVVTAAGRIWGRSGEEIYFVLLFGNLCVPLIDRLIIPRPFS